MSEPDAEPENDDDMCFLSGPASVVETDEPTSV
jgi:hypothetical protein